MATTEEDTQASPTSTPPDDLILAEDGDVILVIMKKQRVRVSSTVLALASPVFKQMLGPHFLEGQAPRSAEQPTVIQLPEDGTWEMRLLLAWMHHHDINVDMDQKIWDPVHVTCIAAHIDKYACSSALRLTVEAVLTRRLENIDPACRASYIFKQVAWTAKAAYLLGASDLFTRCTRRLILDGLAPYSDIPSLAAAVDLANKEILPVTVLPMEEQRSKVRSLLLHEVSMISEGCVSRNCSSVTISTTFAHSMADKQDTQRWPPVWGDSSLCRVLKDLAEGGDVHFEQTVNCRHVAIATVTQGTLSSLSKRIEQEVYGVCFACARQDKMQSTCEHTKELKEKAARSWHL
ncbi:hypothetical protein LTR56_004850 [Elasticomyces elasticus]|nr:hypothetical protein LTR56_004850 [Elasticomyces elasticus]KAK3664624.1 hypothetical protein LTR22_004492 [Elasticomyces elasticus]KAK4918408.1 hypothetical protein LTR49_013800 [Elasticomyces elasticus]KAK5760334.1 hypothetical protein LTS12_009548 [Elasticomyces elasticus]